MNRAVFLDRDGVLNRSIVRNGLPYPPSGLAELEILDEARTACKALREAGFLLICVTNQPDVGRGTADIGVVDEINDQISKALTLDAVYVCPHDNKDNCDCRKPKPGLLRRAAEDYSVDLSRSFMVGDRWRDVDAGRAAGCRTIFVQRSYNERQPTDFDAAVLSTDAAAAWILGAPSDPAIP